MFADFNRILLCTNKTNCQDARKYLDYIFEVIKSKPLFSTIDITAKTYWEHLVWMDQANFGGVEEVTADALDMGRRRGRKRRVIDDDDDEEQEELEGLAAPRTPSRRARKRRARRIADEDDDEADGSAASDLASLPSTPGKSTPGKSPRRLGPAELQGLHEHIALVQQQLEAATEIDDVERLKAVLAELRTELQQQQALSQPGQLMPGTPQPSQFSSELPGTFSVSFEVQMQWNIQEYLPRKQR